MTKIALGAGLSAGRSRSMELEAFVVALPGIFRGPGAGVRGAEGAAWRREYADRRAGEVEPADAGSGDC